MTIYFTNKDTEDQKEQNPGYIVSFKFEIRPDKTLEEHVLLLYHTLSLILGFVSLPSLKYRMKK